MMRNRMVHWNEKVDHGVKIKMYSKIERREKKKKEKRETILQHLPFSSYPYQIPNLHACRYPRVSSQQAGYRWQTFCQNLLMGEQIPGLTCPGLSTLSIWRGLRVEREGNEERVGLLAGKMNIVCLSQALPWVHPARMLGVGMAAPNNGSNYGSITAIDQIAHTGHARRWVSHLISQMMDGW